MKNIWCRFRNGAKDLESKSKSQSADDLSMLSTKFFPDMTYNVFGGTLNLTQSTNFVQLRKWQLTIRPSYEKRGGKIAQSQ